MAQITSSPTLKHLLLCVVAAIAMTAAFLSKGPMQDVHWDAPIYLLRGKAMVDTPLLESYRIHAKEIADALPQYKPGLNDTPYWGFLRLGNNLVLGAVTAVMGANLFSLQIATALYAFLLACSLICAILLSLRIIEILGSNISKRACLGGAILSGGIYLASDTYRSLSGNLVGEIPAMFLLTTSALSLAGASSQRSMGLGMLSGVLGFAVYVCKMELVWTYLSFALVFAAMLFFQAREKLYWPAFIASGFTAAALYIAYAWWFYPLANPNLFLIFAVAQQEQTLNPIHPLKLWIVAGGLLWIGLLLGFRYQSRNPALWLAAAWLGCITLPHFDTLLHGSSAQVRFFALIMPPLLMASTVGWAGLLDRAKSGALSKLALPALLTCVAALIALSHAESYQLLRQLPGGWRLQLVKAYLSPPAYERVTYPLAELEAMSHVLYQGRTPTIVVMGKGVAEEYGNLIAYFGPKLPSLDPFTPQNKSLGECGRKPLLSEIEPVMFCTSPPSAQTLISLDGKARILELRKKSPGHPEARDIPQTKQTLFETTKLTLLPWQGN